MRRTRWNFGVWGMVIAVVALAGGCSDHGTSTTSPSALPSAGSAAGVGGARGLDPLPPVSTEWTLSGPAAFPNGGCISIGDVQTATLDWTVTALAGHPDAFLIEPLAFHKETAGCGATDDEKRDERRLTITGRSQYVANEQGTSTLSWSADGCKDGGRFEIDILIERVENSEQDSDKQTMQTIVNCGVNSTQSAFRF